MRPPFGEEETSASVPKPTKGNKRKRASTSEDPEPKTRTARKPMKKIIPLIEESARRLRDEDEEEEENDGSILVSRVKKTIDAPKVAGSMVVYKAPPQTEGISERDSDRVPESLEIEDASHRSQQTVGISEGASPEALRIEENAPSESLGEIVIRESPTLPAFYEGAIQEAQDLGTLDVGRSHEGEDPFRDLFTSVEDIVGPSDVSSHFCEASSVHREACSRSRAELSRYEADLRRVTEERNTLKLLCGKREEEIRDLRAELARAHQDQTDLTEQLQQKLEVIGKLREEVDTIRAEALGWKYGMDRLAAEKETARAQLSSAGSQLQGMKERSSVQARKIEELEARLASELAKAISEAEKAKANADTFVAVYRVDAEATQVQAREAAETAKTRAHWVAELAKCQSRRETLEEIHARGFDLTEEIKRAKELEADAGALAFDGDNDGSESGSDSRVEPDGEETTPVDN
ncbi:nuclear matrix constituent protein 1b-like [Nicotiana tomentosiformis]|uniref:nuclear matrix constituent protein 1b-like n=1 Tax=Nicotiana tomentosiformis TaxID=4098 RepID=UPI00388C4E21